MEPYLPCLHFSLGIGVVACTTHHRRFRLSRPFVIFALASVLCRTPHRCSLVLSRLLRASRPRLLYFIALLISWLRALPADFSSFLFATVSRLLWQPAFTRHASVRFVLVFCRQRHCSTMDRHSRHSLRLERSLALVFAVGYLCLSFALFIYAIRTLSFLPRMDLCSLVVLRLLSSFSCVVSFGLRTYHHSFVVLRFGRRLLNCS